MSPRACEPSSSLARRSIPRVPSGLPRAIASSSFPTARAHESFGGGTTLFVKPINGASKEVLLDSPDEYTPEDWSPDGRFVSLFTLPAQGKRNFQVWVLSMVGDRKATPFATEAPNQEESRFSPDGRWIAFQSEESGKPEVYVRPFPGPGGQWQVSTAGGGSPRWRRDGKELFYLSADNKIMAVPVRLGPTFQAEAPTALFSVRARHPLRRLRRRPAVPRQQPLGRGELSASDSAHRLDGAPQGIRRRPSAASRT